MTDLEQVTNGPEVSDYALRAGSSVFLLGMLFHETDHFVIKSGCARTQRNCHVGLTSALFLASMTQKLFISHRRERDIERSLQRRWTLWQLGSGGVLLSGLVLWGSAFLRADTRVQLWYR